MKAHGLLLIQRKGKDSKKPSMRPIRIPLEPAERSLPRSTVPQARWAISASLEGNGSTLEQMTDLRLARG